MILVNGGGTGSPQKQQARIGRGQESERIQSQAGPSGIKQDRKNVKARVYSNNKLDEFVRVPEPTRPGIIFPPGSRIGGAAIGASRLGGADEFSAVGTKDGLSLITHLVNNNTATRMVKLPFPFDTPAPFPYDSTLYHKNYAG